MFLFVNLPDASTMIEAPSGNWVSQFMAEKCDGLTTSVYVR